MNYTKASITVYEKELRARKAEMRAESIANVGREDTTRLGALAAEIYSELDIDDCDGPLIILTNEIVQVCIPIDAVNDLVELASAIKNRRDTLKKAME